jgi:hypothetical protein
LFKNINLLIIILETYTNADDNGIVSKSTNGNPKERSFVVLEVEYPCPGDNEYDASSFIQVNNEM